MTTVTTGTTTAYVPTWTTSTNLGQLTTTSFPSDCLRKLYDLNTIGLGLPWTYNTQGCAVSTCCPSGHFYSEPWAWMTSYYSPGLSCPAEYRKCPPPPSPTALSSQPGETIAFCCPTTYNCPNAIPGSVYWACESLLTSRTSVIVLDNLFNQKELSTRLHTNPSGILHEWQVAYPIQIRWRSEDLIGPPTSGAGPTPPSTPEPLSSGAIAAIVIGAVLGICLISATIAVFVVVRRRRAAAAYGLEQSEIHACPDPSRHYSPGFHDYQPSQFPPQELPSDQRARHRY